MAVVESVKAASEVYAPIGGEVLEVNNALTDAPATVNEDALGKGWFAKIKLANKGELDGLMDEAAYKAYVDGLHKRRWIRFAALGFPLPSWERVVQA